ncbi:hypothetical protein [Candidatus Neoehrlichia procyonis]|uniref:Uncharacterized protein n=1 Tax=Candidatus Neoehrlichia procyonis str. RAC413 TaxID=1359163 RepID=A0A0F3NR56_9RICK|nr:hypothetical protein [Candidatus Neoehrlichia lotoris]KJV69389.1 hypothetical protein NLO413_0780 [Candidatus Neoehrlichia lotoris str. RAC413]
MCTHTCLSIKLPLSSPTVILTINKSFRTIVAIADAIHTASINF